MPDEEDRDIHPSHILELNGEPYYQAGSSAKGICCYRCMKFVAFEGSTYKVTEAGANPCTPIKIGLR